MKADLENKRILIDPADLLYFKGDPAQINYSCYPLLQCRETINRNYTYDYHPGLLQKRETKK